jgi:NAD(P)-dependent dehydrogenase (short-subunit alcohol dehydrogenase family)
MRPEPRTVVVTGAASGVGRAVALRFGAGGDRVVLVDQDVAGLAETARTGGGEARVVDLCVPEAIAAMAADLAGSVGSVDVVVNAAGMWQRGSFASSGPEDWHRQLDVNLLGPLHLVHALLPLLAKSTGGRVVNVVSDAGRVGERDVAVYAAAKAGLAAFSRCLALELAPSGVTVNCVSLSAIDTPGLAGSFTADERARMPRHYPLGRLGTAEDVAGAVEYLAGPDAGWVTGQTLVVNGGYVMA